MKTSVVMTRKMGEFDVLQRTSDGYFDANKLLVQWKSVNTSSDKKMANFLSNKKTIEFIEVIISRESTNMQLSDNEENSNSHLPDYQVVKVIKGRTDSTGKKKLDQVWMHPMLFIDFAMWLNPEFKYDVLKFVHDELIKFRHASGDSYKKLSSAIQSIGGEPGDYSRVAKALNFIVFNVHSKDIRNVASAEQLEELHRLEDKLTDIIDMGFVNDIETLINMMRGIWNKKYNSPF